MMHGILEKVDSKVSTSVMLIFLLAGFAFELFWFNPTAFNSIMNYLNFEYRMDWKQLLPLTFVLNALKINASDSYKLTKLWDAR